jgi:hypothetical protein
MLLSMLMPNDPVCRATRWEPLARRQENAAGTSLACALCGGWFQQFGRHLRGLMMSLRCEVDLRNMRSQFRLIGGIDRKRAHEGLDTHRGSAAPLGSGGFSGLGAGAVAIATAAITADQSLRWLIRRPASPELPSALRVQSRPRRFRNSNAYDRNAYCANPAYGSRARMVGAIHASKGAIRASKKAAARAGPTHIAPKARPLKASGTPS